MLIPNYFSTQMKKRIFCPFNLFLIFIVSFTSCSTKMNKPVIEIKENEVGMIGYGSLLSLKSMESTLGRKYTDSVCQVHLLGYQREWTWSIPNDDKNFSEEHLLTDGFYVEGNDTIPFKKRVYLNIRAEEGTKINCMLYIISKEELLKFDKRETGFQRLDVTDKIEELNFKGGKVYVYQASPAYGGQPFSDRKINVISKSYIDLVQNACDSLGAEYRKEFDASTTSYDPDIVAEKIIWLKRK